MSSILDIRMKDGNNKKKVISGGIGSIFSRFTIESPIVKNKSSFILALRRSYADILAKPFLKNSDFFDDGAALNFYDLTAKTNFEINEKKPWKDLPIEDRQLILYGNTKMKYIQSVRSWG